MQKNTVPAQWKPARTNYWVKWRMYIHRATRAVDAILGLLSYLKTFWRSAQQSFTSLCFCVTPAARAGWRLDSWDTLTSSIYHTQACRLGREGFCNTLSGSDRAALLRVKRCFLPWFGWRCHVFLYLRSCLALGTQICFPSEREDT